jgi:hypothetical protein
MMGAVAEGCLGARDRTFLVDLLGPFDRGIGAPAPPPLPDESRIPTISALEREVGEEHRPDEQAEHYREQIEHEATASSAHQTDHPKDHDEHHRADERPGDSKQVDVLGDPTLARALIADTRLYLGGALHASTISSAGLIVCHAMYLAAGRQPGVPGSASLDAE